MEKFSLSEAEKSSIAEKINKIDDVERLEELMISVIRLETLEELKKQVE